METAMEHSQEFKNEMNGSTVPTSGDIPYGAIKLVTDRDREHREDFVEYVLHEAEAWHRAFLTWLYDLWTQWNEHYFASRLLVPYVLLAEPKAPGVYGDCALVSGFGGKAQIRLRPSLLKGTHIRLREGEEFAEGRFRFVADVLLHEMIHQHQQEVTGLVEESFHGHGPTFRDTCNRIGADLGLPPVRTSKKRGPDKDLPSCAQWPHNVRPLDYYLGAYVPPEEKPEDLLAEAEAALITAAVAFGDANAEEPTSSATRESAREVLMKARELRDVVRGVPPSGDVALPDLSDDADKKDSFQRKLTDAAEENEALEADIMEATDVMMDVVKSLLRGKKKEAYLFLVHQLYRMGMVRESDLPFLGQITFSNKDECKEAEEVLIAS